MGMIVKCCLLTFPFQEIPLSTLDETLKINSIEPEPLVWTLELVWRKTRKSHYYVIITLNRIKYLTAKWKKGITEETDSNYWSAEQLRRVNVRNDATTRKVIIDNSWIDPSWSHNPWLLDWFNHKFFDPIRNRIHFTLGIKFFISSSTLLGRVAMDTTRLFSVYNGLSAKWDKLRE